MKHKLTGIKAVFCSLQRTPLRRPGVMSLGQRGSPSFAILPYYSARADK